MGQRSTPSHKYYSHNLPRGLSPTIPLGGQKLISDKDFLRRRVVCTQWRVLDGCKKSRVPISGGEEGSQNRMLIFIVFFILNTINWVIIPIVKSKTKEINIFFHCVWYFIDTIFWDIRIWQIIGEGRLGNLSYCRRLHRLFFNRYNISRSTTFNFNRHFSRHLQRASFLIQRKISGFSRSILG